MSDTRNIHESYDDILQLWVDEEAPDPFDTSDGRGRKVTATL